MGENERFELTTPIGAFWEQNTLGRTNFPTLSLKAQEFCGRRWSPKLAGPYCHEMVGASLGCLGSV